MLLSEIKRLYKYYKDLSDKEEAREQRIRQVYRELRPEADSFRTQKGTLSGIADEYSNGKWKGCARNKFDEMVDALRLEPCYKKLDNYCDRLNSEAQKANRKTRDYVPIISDLWTAIQNWKD